MHILSEIKMCFLYFTKKKGGNARWQITELNKKLKYAVSPDDAIMKHIEEIIDSTDLNMNEYFNQIVRTVIECLMIIDENRIKIKYVDGSEVNVGL